MGGSDNTNFCEAAEVPPTITSIDDQESTDTQLLGSQASCNDVQEGKEISSKLATAEGVGSDGSSDQNNKCSEGADISCQQQINGLHSSADIGSKRLIKMKYVTVESTLFKEDKKRPSRKPTPVHAIQDQLCPRISLTRVLENEDQYSASHPGTSKLNILFKAKNFVSRSQRIKSIMSVKGEQQRAVQELGTKVAPA